MSNEVVAVGPSTGRTHSTSVSRSMKKEIGQYPDHPEDPYVLGLILRFQRGQQFKKYKSDGDNAFQELCEINSGFLAGLAGKYLHSAQIRDRNITHQDLTGAGALGYAKAAEGFELGRGCKFLTTGGLYAEQHITAYYQGENEGPMRVPGGAVQSVELARQKSQARRVASIHGTGNSEDAPTIEQDLTARGGDPADSTQQDELLRLMMAKKEELVTKEIISQRDSTIVDHYFGLNDKEKLTLEAIGKQLPSLVPGAKTLSKERVNQVVDKVLATLRRHLERSFGMKDD